MEVCLFCYIDIKDEEVCEQELQGYHDNKEDIDKYLGPYPYDK